MVVLLKDYHNKLNQQINQESTIHQTIRVTNPEDVVVTMHVAFEMPKTSAIFPASE
jgi:hypothetical protein